MAEPNENPDQPKAQSFSLEELTAAMNAEFDKRFSGIQSLLDRRTSELDAKLEELKTADLSPEEQEQFASSKRDEEFARIARENELLRMRKQFPEEVDLLDEFFKKSSLEDQLSLLASFRKAQAEAKPTDVDADAQPTPVDKNNSPRRQTPSLSDYEGQMDERLADKVLDEMGSEKGMLRKILGR